MEKFLYMRLDFILPIGKKIHKDEISKITAAKNLLGSKVRTLCEIMYEYNTYIIELISVAFDTKISQPPALLRGNRLVANFVMVHPQIHTRSGGN